MERARPRPPVRPALLAPAPLRSGALRLSVGAAAVLSVLAAGGVVWFLGRGAPGPLPPVTSPDKPVSHSPETPREEPRKSDPPPVVDPLQVAHGKVLGHFGGSARLSVPELRECLGLLQAHPESPWSGPALVAFAGGAEEVERRSKAALERRDLSAAEAEARRLGEEFPLDPWPGRAGDLLKEIATRAGAKAPPASAPAPAVQPPAVPSSRLNSPAYFDLSFIPGEAVFSSDGRDLLVLDRAQSALVRISMESRQEIKRVSLPPEPVRLARRGGQIAVACRAGGAVALVDEKSLSVGARIQLPTGKPCAIAAPERDPLRIYAADGERLFVILAAEAKVVESVEHQRRTVPARFEPEQPVEMCAHPDGTCFHVWRLGIGSSEACTLLDRTPAGALRVSRRYENPGPQEFDPLGQYLLGRGELTSPDRREVYGRPGAGTVMAFHPGTAWGIGLDPPSGTLFLYDLNRQAVVEKGQRLPEFPRATASAGSFQTEPLPFQVLVSPEGTQGVVLGRDPLERTSLRGEEGPKRRIWFFSVRTQGAPGRLALGSLPPSRAEVGYPLRIPIRLFGTAAEGAHLTVVHGPEGLTEDPGSRTLSWTPTLAQRGEQTVELRVASADQSVSTDLRFRIDVGLRALGSGAWGSANVERIRGVELTRDGGALLMWQDRGPLLVYDLASDTPRFVDPGEPILGAVDVESKIYILTSSRLVSTSRGGGGRIDRVAPVGADGDAAGSLQSSGGRMPLSFEMRVNGVMRYSRYAPGTGLRPLPEDLSGYETWTTDSAGAVFFGMKSDRIEAIRIDRPKPAIVWKRTLEEGTRGALPRLMPDGKRLRIRDSLLSAESGATLKRFEGREIGPDPTGTYVALAGRDGLQLLADGSFKEVDAFAIADVQTAFPLHALGLLVLVRPARSVWLLPYPFKTPGGSK